MEGYPMRLRALFSAVVLFFATSAFSQDVGPTTSFKNGVALYEACTAASESAKLAFCLGYVMGVSDSLQSLHLTCSPKEATGQQVVDLVVNRLRDHPDVRQYVAAQEVTLALVKAFPCSKK
jgi:hypothetical protein